MARAETVLRIFVSSPSDVTDEVNSVKQIVEELNAAALRTSGIRLEVATWRTDVVPGIADDTQTVINNQIADEYDIFVGILWTRFGTPTPRAGSGTEEEFEHAYSRYKSQPNSVRVMFYFKEEPPPKLSAIDPDQLKLIRCFKSKLGEKGTLYFEFETHKTFEVYLRSHLIRQVQSWSKEWGDKAETLLAKTQAISKAIHEHMDLEQGALDLIEDVVRHFALATDALEYVNRLFEDVTDRSGEKIAQIQAIKKFESHDSIKDRKYIVDSAATDLDLLAKRLSEQITRLSESLLQGLDSFSKVLTYKDCFNTEDLDQLVSLKTVIKTMIGSIESSRAINIEVINAVLGLPRMTTTLNRAKRSAAGAIQRYVAVLDEALQLCKDASQNCEALFSDTPFSH